MASDRRLPQGWIPVNEEAATSLAAELRPELPRSHQLSGRSLRAVARCEWNDDVLFQSTTGEDALFCVHLTWAVERNPQFPSTTTYTNLVDFLERWPREQADDADENAG